MGDSYREDAFHEVWRSGMKPGGKPELYPCGSVGLPLGTWGGKGAMKAPAPGTVGCVTRSSSIGGGGTAGARLYPASDSPAVAYAGEVGELLSLVVDMLPPITDGVKWTFFASAGGDDDGPRAGAFPPFG